MCDYSNSVRQRVCNSHTCVHTRPHACTHTLGPSSYYASLTAAIWMSRDVLQVYLLIQLSGDTHQSYIWKCMGINSVQCESFKSTVNDGAYLLGCIRRMYLPQWCNFMCLFKLLIKSYLFCEVLSYNISSYRIMESQCSFMYENWICIWMNVEIIQTCVRYFDSIYIFPGLQVDATAEMVQTRWWILCQTYFNLRKERSASPCNLAF